MFCIIDCFKVRSSINSKRGIGLVSLPEKLSNRRLWFQWDVVKQSLKSSSSAPMITTSATQTSLNQLVEHISPDWIHLFGDDLGSVILFRCWSQMWRMRCWSITSNSVDFSCFLIAVYWSKFTISSSGTLLNFCVNFQVVNKSHLSGYLMGCMDVGALLWLPKRLK